MNHDLKYYQKGLPDGAYSGQSPFFDDYTSALPFPNGSTSGGSSPRGALLLNSGGYLRLNAGVKIAL